MLKKITVDINIQGVFIAVLPIEFNKITNIKQSIATVSINAYR